MKQLLFVCTGNICRSPIAEGIVRSRSQQERISHNLYVHSAGTQAVVGSGASRNGIEVMASMGIDIRRHVAKQVTFNAVADAHLIIVMEEAHRAVLFNLAPGHMRKIILLSELSGRTYDIPDPYGGPLIDYQIAFARINGIINAAWTDILDKIDLWGNALGNEVEEDEETTILQYLEPFEPPDESTKRETDRDKGEKP